MFSILEELRYQDGEKINLEICVDNYKSMVTAVENGADRIELCASLSEGGLTPPYSFIEAALKIDIPVFVMIRPRSCDFLYSDIEIEMMHRDIYMAKKFGAPGVVFGVLTEEGEINATAMRSLVKAADGMAVTCHRAVDQVRDIFVAIDTLADLGVKRILTSGQAETPFDGIETLNQMVEYAQNRIMLMAAGVTPQNVREIINKTGVDEVHSAAAAYRHSKMEFVKADAKMGHGDDFSLNIVDGEIVRAIKAAL